MDCVRCGGDRSAQFEYAEERDCWLHTSENKTVDQTQSTKNAIVDYTHLAEERLLLLNTVIEEFNRWVHKVIGEWNSWSDTVIEERNHWLQSHRRAQSLTKPPTKSTIVDNISSKNAIVDERQVEDYAITELKRFRDWAHDHWIEKITKDHATIEWR